MNIRVDAPGFKKTEIGLIPDDWNVKPLLEVCRFHAGKAHEPYIKTSGKYICVNSKFIATGGNVTKFCSEKLAPAKIGDILMVMSDHSKWKGVS